MRWDAVLRLRSGRLLCLYPPCRSARHQLCGRWTGAGTPRVGLSTAAEATRPGRGDFFDRTEESAQLVGVCACVGVHVLVHDM